MTRTIILACLALLAGCSSFRLGAMLYCPYGAACTLQTVTPLRDEAPAALAAPEKAASA